MAQGQGSTSMPPPTPKSGQSALLYLRELRKWAQKNTIVPGKGLYSTQTASGTTLNVKSAPTDLVREPFTIYEGSAANKIRIQSGTVRALYGGASPSQGASVPTLGGAALDSASPPESSALADGTHYVYIKADLSAGPSSATVKYRYEATDPMTIEIETTTQSGSGDSYADSAGESYLLLGTVLVSSSEISNINQLFAGNAAYVWTNMGHFWGVV